MEEQSNHDLPLEIIFQGPTEEDPDHPFVLVGAAHCNFVCKGRVQKIMLGNFCPLIVHFWVDGVNINGSVY